MFFLFVVAAILAMMSVVGYYILIGFGLVAIFVMLISFIQGLDSAYDKDEDDNENNE